MNVQVIVYFSNDYNKPYLFNAEQEIKNEETVKKMVTAAIESANADNMTYDEILSDIDKGIIEEVIKQEKYFSKTVKLTDKIDMQINIGNK